MYVQKIPYHSGNITTNIRSRLWCAMCASLTKAIRHYYIWQADLGINSYELPHSHHDGAIHKKTKRQNVAKYRPSEQEPRQISHIIFHLANCNIIIKASIACREVNRMNSICTISKRYLPGQKISVWVLTSALANTSNVQMQSRHTIYSKHWAGYFSTNEFGVWNFTFRHFFCQVAAKSYLAKTTAKPQVTVPGRSLDKVCTSTHHLQYLYSYWCQLW